MNKIDPSKYISHKFDHKYAAGKGLGFAEFIKYQVNNSKGFRHDSQKMLLNQILNRQDLFDNGFYDEIDDSIDVFVYIKKKNFIYVQF